MPAEENAESGKAVNRLCNEIQLFDLCDLDSCSYREGRFCTKEELLRKFEAINEVDDRQTLLYDENECADDEEDTYPDGYDEEED